MKYLTILCLIILLSMLFVNCNNEEIDKEKPAINLSIEHAFPVNCDTLYFGDTLHFRELFTDNAELGSFSIGIHHNFDHHSHSTEVTECSLDPVKKPVNPYTFIEDYEIPSGLKKYEPNIPILIPGRNSNGDFDDGDYHFIIRLTDKEGWSIQKGLSIKMLHR